jgi:hypothetical protein
MILLQEEAGFVIPIVLGVGLIMMLIATIMILRSQSDRTLATAQTSTNQSLTVAEAGVTKVQAFLNNHRYFATKNFPWKDKVTNTNELDCPSSPTHNLYTQSQNFENDLEIGTDSKSRIISYQVDNPDNPTRGTLTVEGRTLLGTDEVKSVSRLEVNIPIITDPENSFSLKPPGIWARKYDVGNNKFVVTTAIDSGCTSSIDSSISKFPSAKIVKGNPAIKLPKPLETPATCPATLSTAPATPCTINLGSPVTNTVQFPRPEDLTNYPNGTASSGEYIYFIPKGTTGPDNNKSINLVENTDAVIIRPDKKVSFYLEGDLRMTAVSFLGHDCYDYAPDQKDSDGLNNQDNPSNGADDFGYQSDGYTPKSSSTDEKVGTCKSSEFKIFGSSTTNKIEIGGNKNSVLYAFIFAPNAVTSGLQTGANTIIKGSVWVKEWKPPAPTINKVVLVEDSDSEWDDFNLVEKIKPQNIAPYTAWQRKDIP